MSIPKVMCAKCGKPVDSLEWFDDHCTAERVIRAHCHGAVDDMRLSKFDLDRIAMLQLELAEGVAFGKPALPAK